jgi:hypothetical protein
LSVNEQPTHTEGNRVGGGTEYLIYWHSVPVQKSLQGLGIRLVQDLMSEGLRSAGIKISTFQEPRQKEDKPVLIGSLRICDPRLNRVNGPDDEAANEEILAAHVIKTERILRVIDTTLENAMLVPKDTPQASPSPEIRRQAPASPSPATKRRDHGRLGRPAFSGRTA